MAASTVVPGSSTEEELLRQLEEVRESNKNLRKAVQFLRVGYRLLYGAHEGTDMDTEGDEKLKREVLKEAEDSYKKASELISDKEK